MKKQPEITDATRKDFILAFCEYYQQMPIEKITVKDIAGKAGYSRVTFYNYFRDVYDLLNYIEDEFISQIENVIQNNFVSSAQLDSLVFSLDRLLTEHELYTSVLLTNPHSIQFFGRLKDRIIQLSLKNLRLSPNNQKAKYIFELYITGIISILRSWIKNGKDLSPDALAELIKESLRSGITFKLT